MKWSFTIARFLGIDLKVHATFFLIVLLGSARWSDHGAPGMGFGALLMLLLFVCVVLHEFGHAVVAQRFGIPVREIVLLPIGGVALLARNPSKPAHELLIAAAGPLVNVVIVVGLLLALAGKAVLTGHDPDTLRAAAAGPPSLAAALVWLLGMNIGLVVFNLIPAFPLDGGRILRGTLGFFLPWAQATRIATLSGQVIAVALAVYAVLGGGLVLGLIAVMIFFAAGATNAEEQARTVLATRRVGDAYNKHALTLQETDRVSRAVDYLLTSYQPEFAVLRGPELAGVVMRGDLLMCLARRGADIPVSEIMKQHIPQVPPTMPLDEVLIRLREQERHVAAVYDRGAFRGLVSADDIAEANAIYSIMGAGLNGTASSGNAGRH